MDVMWIIVGLLALVFVIFTLALFVSSKGDLDKEAAEQDYQKWAKDHGLNRVRKKE